MSAFLSEMFQKSTFFGEKRQKMEIFVAFQSRQKARENFGVFRARVPSESTIFAP